MDLLERGLSPAANIVLNRYLAKCGAIENFDALTTFPFFLSMRAAIRAKATPPGWSARPRPTAPPLRGRRGPISISPPPRRGSQSRLLSPPPPPGLVAVGGLSGTGKSSWRDARPGLWSPCPAP